MARDQVFISYSHADGDWLKRLQTMLAPLQRQGILKIWADTDIRPGQLWKEEIKQALARAKVAVLLVSPDFLASDFIDKHELPPLLEAARQEGLTILWVPVRYSLYKETDIAHYQAAYDPKTPLSTLTADQQDDALVKIAEILKEVSTSGTAASSAASSLSSEVPTRPPRIIPNVIRNPTTIVVVIVGSVVLAVIVWHLVVAIRLPDSDLDRITGKSDTEIVSIATQALYARLDGKPNIAERMRALRVLKSRAEEAPTPTPTYWEQVVDVLTNYIRYLMCNFTRMGLEAA